jgi:hypothetical protein
MAATGSRIEATPYHNAENGGEESPGLSSPPANAAATRLPALQLAGRVLRFSMRRRFEDFVAATKR